MLWFVGGTTVLMEIQSFLPLFLRQYLKMDVGSAVYASCSFQVGSIGGVIFGGYLYDRLSAKKLTFFLNLCMIITTGSYIFYWSKNNLFNYFSYGIYQKFLFEAPE